MIKPAELIVRLSEGRNRRLIRRAESAQQQRDWHEAEKRWRAVIDDDPGRAGAWIQLGNMLNELERHDEAIAAFRHAGRLDPHLAHAPAGVAGVYERTGHWRDAGEAWLAAIDLLMRDSTGPSDGELTHACTHAAMAARNSGDLVRARDILGRALDKSSAHMTGADTMAIRAALLPSGVSPVTAAFFDDLFDMLPPADAARARSFPGVRRGDLFHALVELAPLLEAGRTSTPFLNIAADLYENSRLWQEAMRLAQWRADDAPHDPVHLERAFRAASAGRRLADARRLARRHARLTGELMLIHQLAELYDNTRQPARARLLFRFLARRWPHSRWHFAKYIVTTAATRSLALADRLTRHELAAGRRDDDIEQAYYRSAFTAGHYDEARRRLVHRLANHDDGEADVLLGYAIANARGIDAAADHFYDLAARNMQPLGGLIGTAHMAMRQRNMPLALDRWSFVATIHPDVANANVERARCAYDMGDVAEAIRIGRDHLRRNADDLAMTEFYAWLLTMNGEYEAALPAIRAMLALSGQNWHAVDLHIICSSQLGTLDGDWSAITAMMPATESNEAISRFYHVLRILIAVGRRDLADRTLIGRDAPYAHLPWTAPYLRAAALPIDDPRTPLTERRWRTTAEMTRADFSGLLDAMSDDGVREVLARADALPSVHIVNKFEQPRGGSELHALDLAAQIGRYTPTQVWSPEMPHPEFTARHAVSHIDPSTGVFPRGGVLVLIGIYFDIARWISHVQPARIVFLYNTFEAPSLFARIEEAWRLTGVRPEILYCSHLMGEETGLTGRFEPSPTDLDEFSPLAIPRPTARPFILGRHSRDVPEKHGRDDWKVYQEVAALGGETLLLGGTCMRGAFPAIGGLQLLKARSIGIPDFLRGLDAYFYRTSTWVEPWGRVVIEAMACGLPVLVHSTGGYAQVIEHEVNGLRFDTTDEAVRLVRRLVAEPELRLRLGAEARRSASALLSPTALERITAFYLLTERDLLT